MCLYLDKVPRMIFSNHFSYTRSQLVKRKEISHELKTPLKSSGENKR